MKVWEAKFGINKTGSSWVCIMRIIPTPRWGGYRNAVFKIMVGCELSPLLSSEVEPICKQDRDVRPRAPTQICQRSGIDRGASSPVATRRPRVQGSKP